MKKMKLALDDLCVETFEVVDAAAGGAGTVFARGDAVDAVGGEKSPVPITVMGERTCMPGLCTIVEPSCDPNQTDCDTCICVTTPRSTCAECP